MGDQEILKDLKEIQESKRCGKKGLAALFNRAKDSLSDSKDLVDGLCFPGGLGK
jgi:hypothetical protein